MNVRFIKSSEKKEIIKELQEQFGIEELPYLLLESGKEKVRGFSGHLSKDEIMLLADNLNIELLGMYMLKKEEDYRLSFDACHLLQNQIKKNILEISKEELQAWLHGQDLQKEAPRGVYVISYEGMFVGCGRSTGQKIANYVPKDRRLKNKK